MRKPTFHHVSRPDRELAARLLALYSPRQPNYTFVQAYLAADVPGEAWVDDLETPRLCLIVLAFLDWSFVGGEGDFEVFQPLIARLQAKRSVLVMTDPRGAIGLPAVGFHPSFARHEFRDLDYRILQAWPENPEAHHRIRTANAKTFDRLLWRDLMLLGYGTAENFLARSRVYTWWEGDQPVCDLYASFRGGDTWELGVVTDDEWQKRGLAFQTARWAILDLHRQGHDTVWSCDDNNPASIALATKLGYQTVTDYEVAWFPKLEPAV